MEINYPYGLINEREYILFRDYLAAQCGILITADKAYLFESKLSGIMAEKGINSYAEFYDYISSGADSLMPQKVIDAMANNETLWFRDGTPWKAMEDRILPQLVARMSSGELKKVRIWFAAVSTGQEAYSTVMCIDDYLTRRNVKGVTLDNFEFVATDVSDRALNLAKAGRYDALSVTRGLTDEYRSKYFSENGADWDIAPRIRNAVFFERHNLLDGLWSLGAFDVIFCRYVLIYFSQQLRKEVVNKIRSVLKPDGALFTCGYILSEIFADGYAPNQYGNMTYYTRNADSV